LIVGQVVRDTGGRLRLRLSADYARLEFLRVLRDYGNERFSDPGGIIAPDELFEDEELPQEEQTSEAVDG
ncbi:MAG: rod shape-determining protein MreC, partial [Pseudomonadota bacterium]